MEILKEKIKKADLLKAQCIFEDGPMVKAVADVDKNILAIDSELHADLEKMLLENGSAQENLWGFNLYPEEAEEYFIEYDSMINVRPRQGNRSRDVESEEVRAKIVEVVKSWVE